MSAPTNSHATGLWSNVLHRQRRVWLRKAIFQVHLWSGLIVGLLATVAGLTGSAVVYREALDRRLAPQLYTVHTGPSLPADDVLARLRHALPTYQVQSLDIQDASTPWIFRVLSPADTHETAYIDATTGTLLGVRGERQGIMNWLDELHTELLGGTLGTWVNGFGGAGLLLLCLTGIVVWWPGRGHIRRSLRIRKPGRWRRFNWDLHTAGGFWISLPLAIQAFTGIFLCFGLGWLIVLFGGKKSEFEDLVSSPKLSATCTAPQTPLASILNHAALLHPAANDVFLILPSSNTASLTVFSRTAKDLQYGSVSVTAFDPCTGTILKNADSRTSSLPLRATLFLDALHFGLIGGSVTKVLWVLLGLTPGTLFVTGFLLWWRKTVKLRRNH